VRNAALRAAAFLGVGLLACLGPYPGIGEKLDVVTQVSGTSYVAVDGGVTRLLILAALDGGSTAPFTRIDERQPRAVETIQGSWSGQGDSAQFATSVVFRLPDESTIPVTRRTGASREQLSTPAIGQATVGAVSAESVELLGAAEVVGRFSALLSRTARLGGTGATDTACAFHVANLAVESSEARVPGFNGPGMTQYLNRDTVFAGILSGSLTVRLEGALNPVATLTYTGYADFEGVVLDGVQVSSTNTSGDGSLSGVVAFRVDREGLPPLLGAVDYGQITLSNGNESGDYLVTLDAGTELAVPAGPRTPSIAECLGL
jgi:hypothetical protein